ncbi:F0F1 ATP synthase subunit A [Clostridium diolis]|uniref:ATP synthase subunit a n=1 Tax=Clostridium beijerinckii TaxID=1520 RepID=A0AAW3WCA3_CLOBE|nr:F0F1 ATP synthase subunit A [Clostridium beijerinckii NRRL B-598]MBC2458025.1 F0F1 ATP synthase subunit A [Clostridium beijerinckii]OVE65714.1 F0F1 ATP synthase subunit A [Clostridium diolis]MBC2476356.1 F0F1 ATP synthase subunit A [Clostridium beijerinckii]PSM56826.1 F0F1 ATP synthase subunit A [Clostridium diolis]
MFRVEPVIPIFSPEIFGVTVDITAGIIIEWIIIAILGIGAFLLTKNLKLKPGKTQAALEKVYQAIRDFMVGTMGEEYESFLPYIGTLMIYLLILNLVGLLGFKPPTSDLSITASFAITTFLVVNLNAIRKNGILGFGKGLLHPFIPMLPLNIIERIILPMSLALRLFGNMVAAVILLELVYHGLSSISIFAQFGIPVILHAYFDLFDGLIQMIVFTMLTMINIKQIAEE